MSKRESPSRGKVNEELVDFIKAILGDRPVAYHPIVAKAVGSVTAAIFLSQLVYWSPRSQDPEGWVYKKRDDITEETGLTRWEQEGARKVLRDAGVLEEKRKGVPPVMHFRLDWQRLAHLLQSHRPPGGGKPAVAEPPSTALVPTQEANEPPPINWRKNLQLNGGNPANQSVGNPPNITETTTETTTENVVVDALTQFGISTNVANNLARSYPEAYIFSKLDLVQWLVETRSPLVGKNPAGYLRRAIEEDYAAPPKYKSSVQRQVEVEARDQAEHEEQERRRQAEADYARAKVLDQQQLAEQYPPQPIPSTTLTTQEAWEQTLDQLHTQVTRPNFEMWLRPTTLVSCEGRRAVIAAPSRYHAETLAGRLTPLVQHALSTVLGTPVQCQYVPVPDLLEAGEPSENGRTPIDARSPIGAHPPVAAP